VDTLARHGFGVTRVPLPPATTPHNLRYLTAKRDRLGHQLDIPHDAGFLSPDSVPAVGE
jgi:hypothetical protein